MKAIGKLRERLTLEEAATAPDGAGGYTTTWVAVATLWAAIEALSGREIAGGDAVKAEITHRILIRHRAGIGPAMRFTMAGRILAIAAVFDPDGRKRQIVCHCIEKDLA